MPRIPLPPTNEEAYQRNVKEQYEMLGRFVEAFELMVFQIREVIITITGLHNPNQRTLFEPILNHSSLTAKPLMDILRVTIAEILSDALKQQEDRKNGLHDADGPIWKEPDGRTPVEITAAERDTLFGVMTAIGSEFDNLMRRRNDLLHGTWFIGYVGTDDPDGAEFQIRRLSATSTGLKKVEGLPKNAAELKALSARCTEVRDWLGRVEECFMREAKISDVFRFSDGAWRMDDPPGSMRTLPRK